MADDSIRFITAISGRDCLDTVNPVAVATYSPVIRELWSGIMRGISSALGPEVAQLVGMERDMPRVIFVRTPRAYPFSFIQKAKRYIVVDEHLIRVTSRFSKFSEYDAETLSPQPYFDELYAERYYLIGDFQRSAYCMASAHLHHDASDLASDLPSLQPHSREELFEQRSHLQSLFIIAHELTHIAIEMVPGLVQRYIEKLRLHWAEGMAANEKRRRHAGNDMFAIREKVENDLNLLTECSCDALALTSILNLTAPWVSAVVSAFDALRILKFLALSDHLCAISASQGREIQENDIALVRRDQSLLDLNCRELAITWSSYGFLDYLNSLGLGGISEGSVTALEDAINKGNRLADHFTRFRPGALYAEHLQGLGARQVAPTSLDSVVLAASRDRLALREFLGFTIGMHER